MLIWTILHPALALFDKLLTKMVAILRVFPFKIFGMSNGMSELFEGHIGFSFSNICNPVVFHSPTCQKKGSLKMKDENDLPNSDHHLNRSENKA